MSDFFFSSVHSEVEESSIHQSYSAPVIQNKSKSPLFNYKAKPKTQISLQRRTQGFSLSDPIASQVKTNLDISNLLGTFPPVHHIKYSDLKDMTKISLGRNSIMYKATYFSEPVAVKVMMPGLETFQSVQREFTLEQHLLSALNHPNIVRFIGCGHVDSVSVEENSAQRFTVTEWLDNSLENVVNAKPKNSFRKIFKESSATYFPNVLPVMLQISDVLRFLHSEVPLSSDKSGKLEITHRAVIPEHFRYNENPQCGLKLISLMNCHLVYRPDKNSGEQKVEICASPGFNTCPLGYTPPEVALRLSISTKSDVYAFAILFWHILKRRAPFVDMSKGAFMSRIVYKGEKLKVSQSWCTDFRSLIECCWSNDPAYRPCMSVVHESLQCISRQYIMLRVE